jgi:hypothetical protein
MAGSRCCRTFRKREIWVVIKVVSLTQPWASLVAIGAKRIETRSWPAKYRGPLAIHAAKGFPKYARELCLQEPFKSALAKGGFNTPAELPLGAVVAICRLDAVWKIDKESWIPEDQAPFGDFTPERYAWNLVEIKRLSEPVPAGGQRGLWEWVVPKGLLPKGQFSAV